MDDSQKDLTKATWSVGSHTKSRAEQSRAEQSRAVGYCLSSTSPSEFSAAPAGARDRDRSRRHARPGRAAATALVVGLVLLGAAPAEAQTVRVLVSNQTQMADDSASTSGNDHAQLFHTGGNTAGYILTSMHVSSEDAEGDDFDVVICEEDGTANEFPSTIASNCTALTAPASFAAGLLFFDHTGLALSANTNYVVVIKQRGTGSVELNSTTSSGEDSLGLSDWSIKDTFYWINSGAWTVKSGSNEALRIIVNGYASTVDTTDATLSALSVSGATLSPAFDAATTSYGVVVANSVTQVTVTHMTNELTATVAPHTDASNNPLTDADGTTPGFQLALSPGDQSIKVRVTAPDGITDLDYNIEIVRRAAVASCSAAAMVNPIWTGNLTAGQLGTSLFGFISFSGDLDDTTFSYGGTNYTISSVTSGTLFGSTGFEFALDGNFGTAAADLVLHVGNTQYRLDDATLTGNTYKWTSNIPSWANGDAACLALTVEGPAVTSVEFTSTPPNPAYAIGGVVEATVTFSEAVDIAGTPQLELDFDGTAKAAACATATNTTTMVCSYTVVVGDSAPNGIAIAANKLTGGTIYATGSTTTSADLTHSFVSIDTGHKVDGIRPTLLTTGSDAPTTSTDGTQVILTFSETISAVDRSKIDIGIGGGNIASTSAANVVAGTTVELDLSTFIDATVMLTVALAADAVFDAAANGILAVAATAVTNAITANEPPEFTEGTSTTRSVAENTASGQNIGAPVTATDADTSDTLTYTLGGTDAAAFGIVSASGQLQTSAPLDYETKASYAVTVSVSDGNGGADSIDVTINVTADRAALVALYNATGGADWTNNTNWLSNEALSEWYRVETDEDGRVTALRLNDNELSGEIPAELGNLTRLSHLALWGNSDLERTVPAAVGVAVDRAALAALYWATGGASWTNAWANPDALYDPLSDWSGVTTGTSGRVTHVRLENRGLVGPVPAAFEVLTDLQELSLNDNVSLYGTLPVRLQELASLANLDVRNTSVCTPAEAAFQTWLTTITFQGTPCPAASFAKPTYSAAEGGPAATVTIRLSAAPGRELTILLTATPAGGATGDDYTVTPASAMFQSTVTEATVEITAVDDSVYEAGEKVVLGFQRPLFGITEQTPATATVTLIDNDAPPPPPSPGGGGGGGGPRQTVPGAPTNLVADGGNEQVTLSWDAPEDDGGSAITDYEYRINGRGSWISIGSTGTTYTVTGLVNGQVYVFQVRAVNSNRKGRASNRVEGTPEVFTLDFAHFANGEGLTSDLVFVNVATHPIRLGLDFYDKEGNPIAAETVVDVTEDLEITEDGSLSVQTAMEPLGELTISTHGQGEVVSGSVKVVSEGPIGGFLRFDLPGIGVAGVGASPPVRDALFPARRQAGGIRTAAALHNLGEEAITVSCRLMSGGRVLEAVEIDLEANGQEARYIEELFTATDTSDFVGSVRCTAPGRFTGIAVELDEGNRIFTTLPVVPVARAGGGGQETVLYFAHFANGSGTTSDLVFVNVSPRPSGPGPTPYHAAVSPSRPALYFYDQKGNLMDPASVVDLTGDLEVTGDGALSIQTEMEPLGELTISTHGRGELMSGSVKVVSEGPIGGVLRYALPGIGVTGVGASPPVRDALFPVRQEGGLATAAAIRNLTESDLVVTCRLMKDGAVLEETEVPLAANGQESLYLEELFAFTRADVSDFVGSVRCTVPPGEGMFTGVAVEIDAENRILTTLPVVPVPERMSQE